MLRLRSLVVSLALFASSTAAAATIPIQLDITDGENSQHLVIDAPLEMYDSESYSFMTAGTASTETWLLEYSIDGSDWRRIPELDLPDHAGFQARFELTNLSNRLQAYSVIATIPIRPRVFAEYQGWCDILITDLNGDGAELSGASERSEYFYMSRIDGQQFRGLIESTARASAGPFETSGFSGPLDHKFPQAGYTPGPAISATMSMEFALSISPQDQSAAIGSLAVQTVPEPSAVDLTAASAICLVVGMLRVRSMRSA